MRQTFRAMSRHALALALLVITLGPAQGAVMLCDGLVSGDGREHAVELEARKLALASWQEKAGPEYPWRLATNKLITCLQSASGKHVCKAAGHPCVLKQVPPEGPLKRLMPSAPGQGS